MKEAVGIRTSLQNRSEDIKEKNAVKKRKRNVNGEWVKRR